MVMSQGRIVDKGTLREVFAPPLHPDTETLLRSVPELRTDWLTDVLAGRDNIAGPTATSLAHAGQDPFASASAARVPIKTRREGE
jgi:ABC-type dipeptide/oligopeptide/nickel transport system ATPase component